MEIWQGIITSFGAIMAAVIAGLIAIKQYERNKKTDLKFENMKKETNEKMSLNNRHIAIIYGELWSLLNRIDADRVYVMQPHPDTKRFYLSSYIEVNRKGVSFASEIVQNVPLGDIPVFSKDLASNCWIFYDNVDEQVMDVRAKSIMKLVGTEQIAVKQLVDISGGWIGSLVAGYITTEPIEEKKIFKQMKITANTIQFILPPLN